MNTAAETARKPARPPGSPVISPVSVCANPACVSAHAIAEAVPMMSRMAPDRAAVSTRIGPSRRQSKQR